MKQDGEGLATVSPPTPTNVALPEGIKLIEAEPIVDRKSVFVGRACQISHPSQVRPRYLCWRWIVSRADKSVLVFSMF